MHEIFMIISLFKINDQIYYMIIKYRLSNVLSHYYDIYLWLINQKIIESLVAI